LGYRRPAIRRPLGSLLILGATAGVAYKLGKNQAQQIQEYTGYPPEELSEDDLKAAMNDLNIQPEPLDEKDKQAIANTPAQPGSAPTQPPSSAGSGDYIEELKSFAGVDITKLADPDVKEIKYELDSRYKDVVNGIVKPTSVKKWYAIKEILTK
jgi:hypothetical protein